MYKAFAVILMLGILTSTTFARWGETPDLCEARYGKPTDTIQNRAGAITAAEYIHSGLRTIIGFVDGKASRLEYLREDGAPLTIQDIFGILSAHEGNSRFIPLAAYNILEDTPGSPEEHAKRLLSSIRHQSWVRDDGVLVATYTRENQSLTIHSAPEIPKRDTDQQPAAN